MRAISRGLLKAASRFAFDFRKDALLEPGDFSR